MKSITVTTDAGVMAINSRNIITIEKGLSGAVLTLSDRRQFQVIETFESIIKSMSSGNVDSGTMDI